MPKREKIEQRFWRKVRKTKTCWLWTGHRLPNGYGNIGSNYPKRIWVYAHRLSYEMHKGKIPNNLQVNHFCDIRHCVNPQHLWVGTQRENLIDMQRKGRCTVQKLTDNQIREIRESYKGNRGEQTWLGKKYGVTQGHIWRIVNRICSGHI